MIHEEITRGTFRQRLSLALDRTEQVYLKVLRAGILLIATLLLACALWLTLSGLYKIALSPDSVEEEVASVAADDITNAELTANEATAAGGSSSRLNSEYQRFYAGFVDRYYKLYRTKFEPFRQPEDKQLSRDEFDDTFIDTPARLKNVASGELDFDQDRADLETLLRVMAEAADKPQSQQRLQKYRTAKKVRVEREVQRTRTAYRDGWDSYSTSCEGWYDYPYGCPVRRAVEIPYTDKVQSMEFPKGTQSHVQIFRAFQDRFHTLLAERRETNARTAKQKREDILLGNLEGQLSLGTAIKVAGGFLALMFFFLLIAIERHQRKLSSER